MGTLGIFVLSVTSVLTVLCLIGLLAAFRQIGLLHRRLPPSGARMGPVGPPVNAPAPVVDVEDDAGTPLRVGGRNDTATVLALVSPGCDGCKTLAPALRSLARHERGDFTVVLAGIDDEPLDEFATSQGLGAARRVSSSRIAIEFGITSSPFIFIIDKDGVVRSKGMANHLDHLESLLHAFEFERGRHKASTSEFRTLEQSQDGATSIEEAESERV